MNELDSVLGDERPIKSIESCYHLDFFGFTVGRGDITKIEAYKEYGEMSYIPWIAVYKNYAICFRVPASACMVSY